jgi:uncharacterized protein DUF4136
MNTMKAAVFRVAVLLATASAACAPMTVSSHVERGLDLTRYHTFEWGTADALPIGDPRLEKNPFFKDHLEGAVEKQLAVRGLEHSGTHPDLLIHYHASIDHRLDIDHTVNAGYCATENCDGPPVIGFEAGTLILDFIDAETNRLIWRGWAQHAIDDELENHDHMARRIDEAVTRMLARFRPL